MSIAIGVSPCVRAVGCAQYVLRGFAARAYRRRAAGETRTIATPRTRGEGKGVELESSIAFKRTPEATVSTSTRSQMCAVCVIIGSLRYVIRD